MFYFIYFISWLPYLNKLNLIDVFEENIQSIRDQVDFMKECQNTQYIQELNQNELIILLFQLFIQNIQKKIQILLLWTILKVTD